MDADHSLLGAYQDLMDTLPHLAVGGALVFDDVSPSAEDVNPEASRQKAGEDPHGWVNLLGVWRAALASFPELRTHEYTRDTPGVAIVMTVE